MRCSDGVYGELADVVIDPIARQVSHLVIQPEHRHDLARLVPIQRASAASDSKTEIILDCTLAETEQLEPVQKSAYLRIGDSPVEDPNWQVGIQSSLALPYYESLTPGGFGTGVPGLAYDDHVPEVYDRVPKDKIEIRRSSPVYSSDDHHLGHVDGFVVDDKDGITHLVLEHGHLWGKREITIPIGAAATIENDAVTLSLSKDEVEKLKSVPLRRWNR
ncbi:MAG: PRC-barrel domain-containing protein [Solirubrobacteraceae bacterium]